MKSLESFLSHRRVKHAMDMKKNSIENSSDRSQLGPGENVCVPVDVLIANDVYGSGVLGNFKGEFAENAQDKTYLGRKPVYINKDLRFIQDYTFDVSKFNVMVAKLLSPDYRFDVPKLNVMVAQSLSHDNSALESECKAAKIKRVRIASLTGGKTEDSRGLAKYFLSQSIRFCHKHEFPWHDGEQRSEDIAAASAMIGLVTDLQARTRRFKVIVELSML